jgi:hypothetical protein
VDKARPDIQGTRDTNVSSRQERIRTGLDLSLSNQIEAEQRRMERLLRAFPNGRNNMAQRAKQVKMMSKNQLCGNHQMVTLKAEAYNARCMNRRARTLKGTHAHQSSIYSPSVILYMWIFIFTKTMPG